MKLATYRDGSRDGQLVVVSRDLKTAHYANAVAGRLQAVLDDWNFLAPQLQTLYEQLNQGRARHAFPFEPGRCMAPLPRAWTWLWENPQATPAGPQPGRSDPIEGPTDLQLAPEPGTGLQFEPHWGLAVGNVARGVAPAQALESARLVLLVLAMRPVPLGSGAASEQGGAHACAASAWDVWTACAPVAVTPEELGPAWRDGSIHLAAQALWNGREAAPAARADAAAAPAGAGDVHVGSALARLARHQPLGAGAVLAWPAGPAVAAAGPGDTVQLQALGAEGHSLFGAIVRTVAPAPGPTGEVTDRE